MSVAKLFVGQIPSIATEQDVRTLFEAFGRIVEVFIMKDKATGASKGAAFVTFTTKEEADLAIATLHDRHVMSPHTHAMQVRFANPSAAASATPAAVSVPTPFVQNLLTAPQLQASAFQSAQTPLSINKGGRKLFVGQIPRAMTQEELFVLMQEYGTVEEIFIIKDKATGESKGAAFVTYTSTAEADLAIKSLDKLRIIPPMKNPIQVKHAEGEVVIRESKLFVGMLPYTTTEEDLRSVFSLYGTPTEVALIMKNGQSSGSAFVRYTTNAECDAAIAALNGFSLDGSTRRMSVSYAGPSKKPAAAPTLLPQQLGAFQATASTQAQQAFLFQQLLAMAAQSAAVPSQSGLTAQQQQQQQSQYLQLLQQAGQAMTTPAVIPSGRDQRNKQKGPPGANLMVMHLPVEYTDEELYQIFTPFGTPLSAHVFVDPATNLSKGFGFVSFSDPNTAQQAIAAMNGLQIGNDRLKVELKTEKFQPY